MRSVMLGVAFAALAPAAFAADPTDDYTTITKADYIFGCMAANGQTREALERCSCSIDQIATLIPFSEYERAETILRMNLSTGQSAEAFRSVGEFRDVVAELRRAQAEAEITCFP